MWEVRWLISGGNGEDEWAHLSCLVSLLKHLGLFAHPLGSSLSGIACLSIWSPDRTGHRSSHALPSTAQLSWDLCRQDYETHPQWTTWGCFLKSSSFLPQFFPFPIERYCVGAHTVFAFSNDVMGRFVRVDSTQAHTLMHLYYRTYK